MLTKVSVIESLRNMPESFSADELIEKIILIDKIEEGMKQATSGESIDDGRIDEHLSKWLD
jgi:hypothetical protein